MRIKKRRKQTETDCPIISQISIASNQLILFFSIPGITCWPSSYCQFCSTFQNSSKFEVILSCGLISKRSTVGHMSDFVSTPNRPYFRAVRFRPYFRTIGRLKICRIRVKICRWKIYLCFMKNAQSLISGIKDNRKKSKRQKHKDRQKCRKKQKVRKYSERYL